MNLGIQTETESFTKKKKKTHTHTHTQRVQNSKNHSLGQVFGFWFIMEVGEFVYLSCQ